MYESHVLTIREVHLLSTSLQRAEMLRYRQTFFLSFSIVYFVSFIFEILSSIVYLSDKKILFQKEQCSSISSCICVPFEVNTKLEKSLHSVKVTVTSFYKAQHKNVL